MKTLHLSLVDHHDLPRGGARSITPGSRACSIGRWQILWRPDDISSASRIAVPRRARPGVSRIGSTWRSRATGSRLARELAWCTQPNGVLRSVTGRGLDSRDGAYDAPRDLAVPPCSQHFDIRVITRPLKLCFERASI